MLMIGRTTSKPVLEPAIAKSFTKVVQERGLSHRNYCVVIVIALMHTSRASDQSPTMQTGKSLTLERGI